MLAQPLPDGRVPVLLSAHDEKLIRQDARRDPGLSRPVPASDRRSDRSASHPPCCGCGGYGGTAR